MKLNNASSMMIRSLTNNQTIRLKLRLPFDTALYGSKRPRGPALILRGLYHTSCSRFQSNGATKGPPSRPDYFISTPIFYVNSAPHIGHLYSALLADAHFRFRSLSKGYSCPKEFWRESANGRVIFSTGTDEHGLKIQQAAQAAGQAPANFCDDISNKFKSIFEIAGIQNTDYIRTTEDRHKAVVLSLWERLLAGGHLYRSEYSGWYSVPDEAFLTSSQVEEKDGSHYSLDSGHRVEWTSEENWCFRLERQKENIIRWIRDDKPIKPALFQSQVLSWLEDPRLQDLSVSRPAQRLHWGIKIPDQGDTIYVWLDALANYLTVAGYNTENFVWPPDVHIIGKDILKFHCVYWPAFLLALDLPLPKNIQVHSHWTVDDVKMSKSLGNVIRPQELFDRFTVDGGRYVLLREGVPHSDGNFSWVKLTRYLNSELADTLGNLLNRLTSGGVNLNQIVPGWREEWKSFDKTAKMMELQEKLESLPQQVHEAYDNFLFYQGIVSIMDVLRLTNNMVQEEKPWELKKTDLERLELVLALGLESLRVSGILLSPIIPAISGRLLDKLSIPAKSRDFNAASQLAWHSPPSCQQKSLSKEKTVLFRKIKEEV